MNTSTPFDQPTESELAAAGMTLASMPKEPDKLRDRLDTASLLLKSLPMQPTAASLVFAKAADAPVEAVPIGSGVTVGRGKEASVCLAKCEMLSRKHFSVRPESSMWLLEDHGSRNGTRVDGVDGPITRRMLRDGDIIFAGDLIFLFVNPSD